jgi:hypothetical protein
VPSPAAAPRARRTAAEAVFSEFGECRDGEAPAAPLDLEREFLEGAIELGWLHADGLSEGRIAAELARLGPPAHVARAAAAIAVTDRRAAISEREPDRLRVGGAPAQRRHSAPGVRRSSRAPEERAGEMRSR